ncbi:MAG: hypothetical protein D4S01_03335, partial [Dehalococcoidia bacterium]
MKGVFVLIILGFFLSVAFEAEAKDKAKLLAEEANALYSARRLDHALEKYDMALAETFDPAMISLINFNKATVLYIKGDYNSAIESFTKALATDDKRLEAKASYNLGNSYYRLSELYTGISIDKAIELCGQALYYYRFAIESGARMINAVYNYEFVKKKLDYYVIKKDLQDQDEKKNQRYEKGGDGKGQQEQSQSQQSQQQQQQSQLQDQQDQQQNQQQSQDQQQQQQQQQSQLQDQQRQQQQQSKDQQKQQQEQSQSLKNQQQR